LPKIIQPRSYDRLNAQKTANCNPENSKIMMCLGTGMDSLEACAGIRAANVFIKKIANIDARNREQTK
jgi:hypothetical protein